MRQYLKLILIGFFLVATSLYAQQSVRVERFIDYAIIDEYTDPSIGENIQGPSLIRVPDWVKDPLGRYYLYFADHYGKYIRLAYADDLAGPWTIYVDGSLRLEDTHLPTEPFVAMEADYEFATAWYERRGLDWTSYGFVPTSVYTEPHVASPDVHVDEKNQRLIMYFHGLFDYKKQRTGVATSKDGIRYKGKNRELGKTYWRAFTHDGYVYAITMPGQLQRSTKWLKDFELGPKLFSREMRHSAVLKRGETLYVFWSQCGNGPERILASTINISKPFLEWQESRAVDVLEPEKPWEGVNEPLMPSYRGNAFGKVRELRDPAIFVEDNQTYLLYSIAGESGIGIVKLHFD